jgi:hypothetical protein
VRSCSFRVFVIPLLLHELRRRISLQRLLDDRCHPYAKTWPMIFYYRKGQYRTVSVFAARTSLTLWLVLSNDHVEKPRVIQGPVPGSPSLTDEEIRAAVATGTAAANAEYGTRLFPTEIKVISEGGNDSLEWAAFLIIERLATRGDSGFELLE